MSGIDGWIGSMAGFCTTLAFLPQVLHTWRSRSARDISLTMYAVLCSGISLWIVYGVMIASLPIIVTNGVTLVLALAILLMKLRWDRRPAR